MKLDLIPTDDLIKELDSRFDVWVFKGVKKHYKGPEDMYENSYHGGLSNCLGLCEVLKAQLLKYYFEGEPEELK